MTEKLVEARFEIDTEEWAHASVRTERPGYTSTGLVCGLYVAPS
jgi:hypothetical protein